jgi:hypothetical protein
LLRCCVPPPHVSVHALMADQLDSTQSTGQTVVPQSRVCWSSGQAAPPLRAAVTTVRVRVAKPPPHEAEHTDQPEKVPVAQSTAQGASLQVRVSLRNGHCVPWPLACATTERVRRCVPPPHGASQVVHAEKTPTVQ